jgi:hypothetical protein
MEHRQCPEVVAFVGVGTVGVDSTLNAQRHVEAIINIRQVNKIGEIQWQVYGGWRRRQKFTTIRDVSGGEGEHGQAVCNQDCPQ